MPFNAHGDIRLAWVGNLFVVAPFGSINEEGAIAFNRQIEEAIVQYKEPDGWYRMEYLTDPATLCTPDVIDMLTESFAFTKSNGCQLLLIVGGNQCMSKIATDCCNVVGLPIEIFADFEEWLAWSKSTDFPISDDEQQDLKTHLEQLVG